jgi:hypothetical protein
LERFRADVPPVEPDVLAAARARLRAEATGTARSRPVPVRYRWRLVAAAAAVVTAAAGVFVVDNLMGVRVPTTTPDTEAAKILLHAALVAQRLPDRSARSNQFVFVESVTAFTGTVVEQGKPPRIELAVPKLRQIWLSVDGSRDGLLRERPRSGTGPVQEDRLSGSGPPAYLTDLPTNTDAMVRYLYRNSHGQNPPDQQAFITVGDLIREAYVPPASLSAMFSAAARIPGVEVVRDAVDASGRHGIAVSRTFGGVRSELIFDPVSYAFLGEREVATKDQDGLTTGMVVGSTAVLRVTIVDRAGQLP